MKSFPKTLDKALSTPWDEGPLFDDAPIFVSSLAEANHVDRHSLPSLREARKRAKQVLSIGTLSVDIVSTRKLDGETSVLAVTRFYFGLGELVIKTECTRDDATLKND